MIKARKLRLVGPVAVLGALAVATAGGSAGASTAPKAETATITAEVDGRTLFFEAPETVEPGAKLKVVNNTDPDKIGPHTFSLVNRQLPPDIDDKDALKACGQKLKGICGAIIKWHQVDLDTGEVDRNPAEAGKNGWDVQGNLKHRGDSFVTEKEGQSLSQKVTAEEGKTLHFFCAVHPEMQAKVRVEAGV